jgi:phosphoribosyl 1,2-cyclic phosphodiesterase
MLRFASLGSGSKGNATLIQSGETLVLVDCGFSIIELKHRMLRLGCEPSDINTILVTHEHSDHIQGVAPLSRRYKIPVWMTRGTWVACRDKDFHREQYISSHAPFRIANDFYVHPFPVPHDAREPSQFSFDCGDRKLGLLTDVGCATPHLLAALGGCDALMLECNYDPDMLRNGPYPPSLQRRVNGRYGHLSNKQAQALLGELDTSRLSCLIGMHVSEKNNDPKLVMAALLAGMGAKRDICRISVADQKNGFEWLRF